jgi:hypothetical protein
MTMAPVVLARASSVEMELVTVRGTNAAADD